MVRKQTRRRKTRRSRMRGGSRIHSLLLFLFLLIGHFSKVEGVNWGRLKDTLITIGSKLNKRLTDQELTDMSMAVVTAWNEDPNRIVLPEDALDTVESIGDVVDKTVYVPVYNLKDREEYIYREGKNAPVNVIVETWASKPDGSIAVSVSYPSSGIYGTIDVKQGEEKTFEHVERLPIQDPVDGGKRVNRRKTLRRRK